MGPETPASEARANKAPANKAPVSAAPVAAPTDPADVWSPAELADVRAELQREMAALRSDIAAAESTSAAIQQSASGEGPGDEADAGTKTFEREHELSLSNNSRNLLLQVERAVQQLDAGTYGHCESCAKSIPKPRLQAFPRATLCVACKQREERR